jgi:hypothetical protein
MTIKAPAWCENAVPTANGWEDPQTGELYKSGGFTPDQIAEFHGSAPAPAPQMLAEAPVGNKSLDEMTKTELEALGRQHGVELDRRESKQTLVEKTKTIIGLS